MKLNAPSDVSGNMMKGVKRGLFKFSRNPLSLVGFMAILGVIVLAVFAPYIAPYPGHAGKFVNFDEASQPPSLRHLFGTDIVGRDILSRILFGYRFSLLMAVTVLSIVVPVGVALGLIAGYFKNRWIDTLIMRTTDIFLALPRLVLALAVAAVLGPSLRNTMIALSLTWWPWYCRLVYGVASSIRNEFYVQAAKATGLGTMHIVFREILPNCISPILTMATLDMGIAILTGATLGFVGLGIQPPKPGLGTMVAEGAMYMPQCWWMSVFPALAIVVAVLGFNLLGDGVRDLLEEEKA